MEETKKYLKLFKSDTTEIHLAERGLTNLPDLSSLYKLYRELL